MGYLYGNTAKISDEELVKEKDLRIGLLNTAQCGSYDGFG